MLGLVFVLLINKQLKDIDGVLQLPLFLVFIMLFSPFVVGTTIMPTLFCRLEFRWKQKVIGCKVLVKTFALQV
jgi:hypothetical protein